MKQFSLSIFQRAGALMAAAMGVACITFGLQVNAFNLASISDQDAGSGLRQALADGTRYAVESLGKEDGFFGNDKVRIPLPNALQKAEKAMKMFGKDKDIKDLALKMNRAAELAVIEAKPIFAEALKQMTIQDAKKILTGGETAGTEYFKEKTTDVLRQKFRPIVGKVTDKLALAAQYNSLAAQGKQFGLVKGNETSVEDFVTEKALDGLFFMVAEKERAIRKDPVGQASGILQKVFGALR
jgi:Protein of unknown function (DUF4197)